MQYDTQLNNHGLKYNPFKALVTPRPIGWISTLSKTGVLNLAPYSFFNAVSDRPPMVMFSSIGRKDTLINIEETGEFVCSIVSQELRDAMNMSSAAVNPGIDEFKLAGVTPADSFYVKPPRVAEAPAALECRYWKTLPLPAPEGHPELAYWLVLGVVVGVYIDDTWLMGWNFSLISFSLSKTRRYDRFSKIPAAPIPVPTHIVTMPYLSLRLRRPCMTVAERIAPVVPKG